MTGVDFNCIVFIGDDYANDYKKPKDLGCQALLYDPFDSNIENVNKIKDFNELLTSKFIWGEGR